MQNICRSCKDDEKDAVSARTVDKPFSARYRCHFQHVSSSTDALLCSQLNGMRSMLPSAALQRVCVGKSPVNIWSAAFVVRSLSVDVEGQLTTIVR